MGMLYGKIAIITGGTSGIGRRTAALFVEEGAGAIATGILPKALGMDPGKADRMADKMKEVIARAQPIPRLGLPDDIAQCVAWLASDRSTFVNGIDIAVDGGMIGGRMYSPHQEGLRQIKTSLGL